MAIEHQALQSSMITHGGHDGDQTGEVKIGGKTYRIAGITPGEWEAFMAAESLGKHFNTEIKTKYSVERVDG